MPSEDQDKVRHTRRKNTFRNSGGKPRCRQGPNRLHVLPNEIVYSSSYVRRRTRGGTSYVPQSRKLISWVSRCLLYAY